MTGEPDPAEGSTPTADAEARMARAEAEHEARQQRRYERWLDNARGRGVRGE